MSLLKQAENSAKKETAKHYVDCDACSMQTVCQPINSGKQALDLTSNYLTRRIDINAVNTAKSKLKTPATLNQATNTTLFEQDMPLTAIFAVCSGTFKLCQQNEDGTEKIVGFRFPGELMGEDALFLKIYNYTAIALGDNSVYEVFVEQLSSCAKLAPELQQNLLALLTKQSYEQQRNTQALIGRKSAESLLAAFLLNICQRNAKHSRSSTEIELTITHNDIANFLGIRRETISRLLSKFQKEHLIALHNKRLSILSLNALSQLANNS